MKSFLLTTLILTYSLPVWAADFHSVRKQLQRTIYSCPERIWNDVQWEKARFVLHSPGQAKSLEIIANQAVDVSGTRENVISGKYRFDKKGVTLNIDNFTTSESAFSMLIHESFHVLGQKNTKANHQASPTTHPIAFEPRLQREELAQALVRYISNQDNDLHSVATWHYRFLAHGEDTHSDVIEGSAEYVEAVTLAISAEGCNASEERIIQRALTIISQSGVAFDRNLEAYRVGALSFLLARKLKLSPEKFLSMGIHPLDKILTRNLILKDLESDTLLEHSAEMYINLTNSRNQQLIDFMDQEGEFVFIPYQSLIGSFTHRGTFVYNQKTYFEDLTVITAAGEQSGHAISHSACGQEGFLIKKRSELGTGKLRKKIDAVTSCP